MRLPLISVLSRFAGILDTPRRAVERRAASGRRDAREWASACEALEPRQLLATFTVSSLNDGGPGSLRQAIQDSESSPGADVVEFDGSLNGAITLSGGSLNVSGDLQINGPGASVLAIDGNNASGVLAFGSGTYSVSGLAIRNGSGAGVTSICGAVTLSDVTIAGNHGGGISSLGTWTVTDSIVVGNSNSGYGGGIFVAAGSLTLVDSTVSGNSTLASGGGIYSSGTLIVNGSTISANTAAASGGGIESESLATITGSTITSNTGQGSGGGIVIRGAAVISGSTIHQNTTLGTGGGVANGGSLSLMQSTLSGNRATSGGAIWSSGEGNGVTVSASSISGNNASGGSGGGIANQDGSTVTVTHSALSDNIAFGNTGGGIFNWGATVTVTDSTLSGNASGQGGAISNTSASMLTISNSTISGNVADNFGAGLMNQFGASAVLAHATIAGNIVRPIKGGGGAGIANQGSLLAGSTIIAGNLAWSDLSDIDGPLDEGSNHNLVQDAIHAGGLTNGVNGNLVGLDPLVGELADNGGPTQTMAVLPGSPAINSGSIDTALATDQRGLPRVRGVGIDIGAYEFSALPTLGSLTTSSASVMRGHSVTLTAGGAIDSDGTIAEVDVYVDTDFNGILDDRELIASDADPADGFSFKYRIPTSADLGNLNVLAVAIDNDGGVSAVAATSVPLVITDASPVINSLGASAPAVVLGQSLTLTAGSLSDLDGTIARVDFFRDANNNDVPDSGELVGGDADAAGGHTFVFNTSGLTLGTVQLLAVAIDNDGGASSPASVSVSVVHPFGSYAGQLLGASAGIPGNFNITTQNGVGTAIILQQDASASTWSASDLQAKTGCPPITGEVVTWVDPKDGFNYAAAMSASGLILFTNTGAATWGFRNLTTEVPGHPAISGNLTVFTSGDNIVSIAGVAADGDLIRYFQTGAGSYIWTAVNHGDDLRAQGLAVPVFAGRITSFVTPWDALNVVGLDASGHIQAIWWHASLNTGGRWTTNDLSAQTGAPALSGGLTVWLTSWYAINIAGTDVNGNLSATWWVPNFNNNQWNNNNLTDIIGGPKLEASSMTSWVTSWGAMNIAGRESDGTLGVYWWVPNYNNDNWNVVHFRDVIPTAAHTTGPVSGLTAPGGDLSMSILSTTASGDITRLWWSPSTNVWAEQNLTQIAVPA